MDEEGGRRPNPRRVAAGKANREKRGPLSEAGRERLRAAAHANRPWEHSTGPRTPEGRAQSARNGKARQSGAISVREIRARMKEVRALILSAREVCAEIEAA